MTMTVPVSPTVLIKKMNKANEQAVRRSGPLVRGFMRRQIKFRKFKKSLPGQAPFAHSKGFGLKTIVYKYHPSAVRMTIGPIIRSNDVPGTLERGGPIRIRTRKGKIVQSYVQPRPFAEPAITQFKTKYPDLWRNSIS